MPCFFDLSKAFDSVPHDPLLHTPCNLGLPAHLLCWFRSYLTDRFQQVSISSCLSSKAIVSSGVPQGSILGPLLFILYVNDLPKLSFSPNSSLTMYADDILLSHPIHSSDCLQQVQKDIDLMSSCLSSKLLTINAKKSKYMIVTRKHQSFVSSLPLLNVNNLPLELVTSYKYLGVILTCNLSWSQHIQAICSKARKVIGFIYRTFYNHCPFQTLVKLYVSFVLPHLTYCSSVWDPSPHSINSLLLEKVQMFALKVCSKKWSASYTFLLTYSQLPSLSARHSQSKLTLLFKFLHKLTYLPPNLLCSAPTPTKDLRSYHPLNLITICHCTTAGSNSFSPSASKLWNSLQFHIKETTNLSSFKALIKQLKL